MVCNLTVLKTGVIASSLFIDILFDERGAREDLQIRSMSTGCNMSEEQALELANNADLLPTDLYIVISPAATMPGPKKLREKLKEKNKPMIIITDAGGKKITEEAETEDYGYITVEVDPMIGARKEFLDPQEMVLFNGHVLTTLASIGVVRALQKLILPVIDAIKEGKDIELPRKRLTAYNIADYAEFSNPYAASKATAAARMMVNVAATDRKATWRTKEHNKRMTFCSAGHETAQKAAELALEALEIEKSQDTVLRTVHENDGSVTKKRKLFDKLE